MLSDRRLSAVTLTPAEIVVRTSPALKFEKSMTEEVKKRDDGEATAFVTPRRAELPETAANATVKSFWKQK